LKIPVVSKLKILWPQLISSNAIRINTQARIKKEIASDFLLDFLNEFPIKREIIKVKRYTKKVAYSKGPSSEIKKT